MKDEIRINKRLCTFIEGDRFSPSYWQVSMPDSSKYYGYHFKCSTFYFSQYPEYCSLTRGKDGFIFELIKTERTPGKRYSRPKLTFDELVAEFEAEEKRFSHDDLPYALALIKEYVNNRTRHAGKVSFIMLAVGHYSDTWFYESETSRRRLNTKGVKLLKCLTSDEAIDMKAKLERIWTLRQILLNYNECKLSYSPWRLEQMKKNFSEHLYNDVIRKLEELNEQIDEEARSLRAELKELEAYFNSFLTEGDERVRAEVLAVNMHQVIV